MGFFEAMVAILDRFQNVLSLLFGAGIVQRYPQTEEGGP